jgi:hypothetical protein
MESIRNKVQESGIISMDLADFKPDNNLIAEIDIANHLWKGLVLKEKDFRESLKTHHWQTYSKKYIFVHCSVDAIVPTWAYMLIVSNLIGIAEKIVVGSKLELEKELIKNKIQAIDIEKLKDERVIIKGCSDIISPEFAMSCLVEKLQPNVKSIMYGEPCSTVPIYKKKR